THQDRASHWHTLALLVDPDLGALDFAKVAGDKAAVQRVAKLYLRWLDNDPPSEAEWEAATSVDDAPGQTLDLPRTAAWAAGMVETGLLIAVDNLAVAVAGCWEGKPLASWINHPIGSSSWLSRCFAFLGEVTMGAIKQSLKKKDGEEEGGG